MALADRPFIMISGRITLTSRRHLFRGWLACGWILATCAALADEGDDTLRHYKSKASLVVSGEIVDHPYALVSDSYACHYDFRLKVTRIMRGGVQGDEIDATVTRLEKTRAERLAYLKKGERVILFLRERKGDRRYETVDPWFGVQQYSSIMEGRLDDLPLAD